MRSSQFQNTGTISNQVVIAAYHFVPRTAQAKLVHLRLRRQHFTCDVITELFDLPLEICSDQTGTSKPDMRQLVEKSEWPRNFRILTVEDDERRDLFCQPEASENISAQGGVLGA